LHILTVSSYEDVEMRKYITLSRILSHQKDNFLPLFRFMF